MGGSLRRNLWWVAALVFACGGPILGLFASRLAFNIEEQRAYTLCTEVFASRSAAFMHEMEDAADEVRHLRALFAAAEHPSRDQFGSFAREIAARHPSIVALEWAPRIEQNDRDAHERDARAEGLTDYLIRSVGADGSTVPSPIKPEYYPVFFAEPLEPNRSALGLDLTSEWSRLAALRRAEAAFAPAVTDPVKLVQLSDHREGFLVVMPVGSRGRLPKSATPRPAGFVLLAVQVREAFVQMLETPPGAAPPAMFFELSDTDVRGAPVVMESSDRSRGTAPYRDWRLTQSLALGGQNWRLIGWPTEAFVSSRLTVQPLALGAAVFLFWELLGGIALMLVMHARDERLKASARQLEDLRYAVDQASLVAVTNRSGTIVDVNDKFCDTSGYTREQLLGEQYSVLDSGLHPPEFFDDLRRTVADGGVWRRHVRNKASDGRHFWVDMTVVPLLHDGVAHHHLALCSDITEQMRQEAELRRLSNVVEQTADAVMVTSPAGVIEYVNPAFETTTGYSREEALGQTPRLLRSGKQDAAYYDQLWKTILAGDVFRGSPINRRKNGDLYPAEQTITPIKDAEGQIVHFVSILKDATDRLRIEQQDIEMRYARDVQQRLYPRASPDVPGLDIAGATFPALATCGDYYDYLPRAGGAVDVIIGDVSGHGLGPALIMAETRAYLRFLSRSNDSVAEVLTTMNGVLHQDLDDNRYVALVAARIDPASRRIEYVNAGHTSAFVLDRHGVVKAELDSCGPPLGIMPSTVFTCSETPPIDPGDVVVFLTDGITESEDPDGRDFGAAAALDVVRAHMHCSAGEIVQRLERAARDFAKGAPQADDITAVVCKVESI